MAKKKKPAKKTKHPQSRGTAKKKRACKKIACTKIAPRATRKTKRERPLAWRNYKFGTSGVFRALYREMTHGVPEHLQNSAKERIAMFRAVQAALRNKSDKVIYTGYTTIQIPWTMLEFPPGEVGREIAADLGHIGHILTTYDNNSANMPRASVLPIYDSNNKLIDAHFYISNGWHSRTIYLECAYFDRPADLRTGQNPISVPVVISIASKESDLARAFSNQNQKGVRTMSKRDSWRNEVVAEDPASNYAVSVAAEYGFNAAAPKGKRGWEYFHNGDIVRRLIYGDKHQLPFGNERAVRKALELLSNPACAGVYGNKASLKPNFFGGLTALAHLKILPGYLHNIGLTHVMGRPDFHTRVNEQEETMSKERICVILDIPMKDVGRGENTRYLAYAAAILEVYKQSVPRPMAKSGTWADCPSDLRRLLYDAPEIDDAKARAKFVSQLTTKLNKICGSRRSTKYAGLTRK